MITIRKAVALWFPEIRDVSHMDKKYSYTLYHIVAHFGSGSKRSLKNKSKKTRKRIRYYSRSKTTTIRMKSKSLESLTLSGERSEVHYAYIK